MSINILMPTKFPFFLFVLFFLSVPAMAQDKAAPVCGLSLYTIEGNSMVPLVRPGDKVETMPPSCLGRAIEDGDIIVFTNAAVKTAIIKRVIARGGDRFAVREGAVLVNDKKVTTADGRAFHLSEGRLGMIRLYESGYNGVVPKSAYLVIGEQEGGTTDSTRFGMIDISDIKGVMVNNLSAEKRAEGEKPAPQAVTVTK
ncbi:MAG: signal peptidase I [Micavibrio aeruginosavorus]|uniref:Signal peptidase I n=1 Tax=Micavibrio aeruginosavorus TaxID=349221 RepID=A0A2W4ZPK1_9BACT|nr:MAG: signal peptidase I [Micavibrio aeruginosavorus]